MREFKLQFANSKLNECIQSLPSYGIINYDAKTCYWYIKLPNEWQRERSKIAELAFDFLQHNHEYAAYAKAIELCHEWSFSVHRTDEYDPVIGCVAPPSVAGLHISLATCADDEDKPEGLVKGKKVPFILNYIKLLFTVREDPQNIPGQYTNKEGLRYYPVLWVLVDIKLILYPTIATRYPPHISLACVAVQLSEDDVAEFTFNKNKSLPVSVPSKDIKKQYADLFISWIIYWLCIVIVMFNIAFETIGDNFSLL